MITFTAVLLIGIGAVPAPAGGQEWLSDYGVALREARIEKMPLLVVLHDPTDETHRVEQVKRTSNGTAADLLANYKLCHVDVTTAYGQSVARAFKATTFPHTVVIDRTGSRQIFKKSGPFSTSEWIATLAAYKDGEIRYAAPVHRQPAVCFT